MYCALSDYLFRCNNVVRIRSLPRNELVWVGAIRFQTALSVVLIITTKLLGLARVT